MNPFFERDLRLTRRQFFGNTASGIGVLALGGLLNGEGRAQGLPKHPGGTGPLPGLPHFKPRAKHVIVLWQGGAPSQLDLFDYKPGLEKMRLQELPASVVKSARLSTMTSSQAHYPILPAIKPFRAYGQCGTMM